MSIALEDPKAWKIPHLFCLSPTKKTPKKTLRNPARWAPSRPLYSRWSYGAPYKWPKINGFPWDYVTLLFRDPYPAPSSPFIRVSASGPSTPRLPPTIQGSESPRPRKAMDPEGFHQTGMTVRMVEVKSGYMTHPVDMVHILLFNRAFYTSQLVRTCPHGGGWFRS